MDLSIIIPCYNVEKYVLTCLKSVGSIKNLTYEIILINDGSTDQTLPLIETFKQHYRGNCCIVNQENRGLSAARNAGLERAKGNYVCFIDSDDYVDPLALSKIVNNAKQDNVEIAFGDYKKQIADNIIIPSEIKKRARALKHCANLYTGIEYAERIFDRKINRIISEVCFSIYKNSFIKQHNLLFKEGIYHEDTLFFYQSIVKANQVKYYDSCFYIYNIRGGSITTSDSTLEKRTRDKLYIAHELINIKKSLNKKYYFLDSYIINLCYVCRNIINESNCKEIKIKQYRKLTLKSLVMVLILRTRGIL